MDDRDRLTRVEVRMDEAFRLIDRQEATCRNTAAKHLDRDLWVQGNTAIDGRLADQGQRIGEVELEAAKLREELAARDKRDIDWSRRWWLTIGAAVLTLALTVVFATGGIGGGL